MDKKRLNRKKSERKLLTTPVIYRQISNRSSPTSVTPINEKKNLLDNSDYRSNTNLNKTFLTTSTSSTNKNNCLNEPLLLLSYFCAIYSTVSDYILIMA